MFFATKIRVLLPLLLTILGVSARAEKPATATAPMARLELTSPAQKARLDEKLALAQRIIDRVSDDAQRKGATPEWREGLAASLYRLSNEALQAIEPGITTLDDAHAAAALAAGQAKALGDANNDLVFTPITPCRFVDTRNVGGPVSTLRVFDTANAGSTYGGAAGCALSGIGEPAIALNLTATGMTAPGYLIVRPQGSVNTTSFINWDAGAVQIANAGIVTTQLASNGHYEFEITGNKGAPQVIVDYFGYFSAPAGTITGNGGAGDGVAGITSGAFNSGVYGKNTGGGKGVFGVSATGVAVAGQSTSGTGAAGNSSTGSGVYGQTAGTSGQSGAAGVWGDSHDFYGVWGTSVSGDGVHGNTSSAAGNTSGVAGIGSGANAGVTGLSSTGNGVQGLSSGAAASGVYGHNTTGYGVYGRSDSGYAMGTDGPAFQATNQGGWIKAMVVVAPAGFGSGTHIVRCFNSRLPATQASTPPCGMVESEPSTGEVSIDFGFDVSQRFVSGTALGACSTANNTFCTGGLGGGVAVAIGACAGCFVNSQVDVNMERPDNGSYVDVPFTLIVY